MEMSMREHSIAESYVERQKRMMFKAKGESAQLIFRRIRRLEAEERRFKREVELIEMGKKHPSLVENMGIRLQDEEHWSKWLHHTQERLAIEREAYQRSGGIPMERMSIKKGEKVNTLFGNAEILRINPKTLTVKILGREPEWILKLDPSQIRGKV
jgi:hypothetical protein